MTRNFSIVSAHLETRLNLKATRTNHGLGFVTHLLLRPVTVHMTVERAAGRNFNMKPSFKIRWVVAIGPILAVILIFGTSGLASEEFTLGTARAAAAKGDPRAGYFLARQYADGNGVPQDYSKAAEYLRKSAEQGYAPAQTGLGSCYAHGEGVKQDYTEALRWYRKAAAQEDSLAEYCLGYACAHGKGAPKDIEAAVSWWQKSAERGQVYAQNALGQFYFQGEYPGDTNHINYGNAARWLRKAAEQDYAGAMNNLAFLYQYGWGVNQDLLEAAKWYGRAAQQGDAMAQANLGLMYQAGHGGLPRDQVEAYKWFLLSAEQGNVVGRHSVEEYGTARAITADQVDEAKRKAAAFHARSRTNSLTVIPDTNVEPLR